MAALAGLSLRRYAAFDRGEFIASPATIDQIAAALQMPDPERSALHVLAAEQDHLASQAAGLAAQASGPMAAVLRSVQACIGAAANQLREAGQFTQTG